MDAAAYRRFADRIHEVLSRRLFFVAGAQKSGTTWVQRMLDAHPEILCAGEGHFMDALGAPDMLKGLQDDNPQAIAAMMRQMSESMGEPMDPEVNEVVDRLAAGESPEAIDAAMPALGDDLDD